MSGPKVVKIVTREELIDICRGHIAALEAAAAQWERIGRRNGVITDKDSQAVRARFAAMEEVLAADRFADLQKYAQAEIGFLKADIDDRLHKAVDAKTSKRQMERRVRASAVTVARILADKGLEVPPELSNPSDYSREEIEAAISKSIGSLPTNETASSPSQRQRELASALSQGDQRVSLEDWLKTNQQGPESDPKLSALECLLDELEALDPEAVLVFQARVNSLAAESCSRKALLIDSLTLDVAASKREAKERLNYQAEIAALRAQLGSFGPLATESIAEIDRVQGGNPSVSDLKSVVEEASAALDRLRKTKAELERRKVLLAGLAELGYVVNEGMETAWVENGRVILKKANDDRAGVEVGGNPETALQMRAVTFASAGAPHSTADDIRAETKFCDDIAALRSTLASTGTEFSIVKALGVGATSVKTVKVEDERERLYDNAARRPSEQSRT